MANVIDVVKYFLFLNQRLTDMGDYSITHPKVQKLLYYAQGTHLSCYPKQLLFADEIWAYKHGPVVESVYQALKNYNHNDILKPEGILAFCKHDLDTSLTTDEKEIIVFVFQGYGGYSSQALESRTHKEFPWIEIGDIKDNHPINLEGMQAFFDKEREREVEKIMEESMQYQGRFG